MNKKKPWWQSKTIWGVVIAAAGLIFKNNAIDVPLPENPDTNQIVDYYNQVKDNKAGLVGLLPVAMSVIGFGLSIYGRITAEAKITSSTTDNTSQ